MLSKINKIRLNLSNKYIFVLLSCILVFILTFINNLYFYSHVERTSIKNSVQLEKLLLNYIDNNNEKNSVQLEKELISLVKTWMSNSYYTREITVIDLNNKTIPLMKPNKWDYAASTKIIIDFNKLINKKSDSFLLISQTNLVEIFYTVIKSMSFSVIDILKDISTNINSEFDGKIILIEDAQEKLYDGIININGKKFEDIKGAKYIVISNLNDSITKSYFIPPYNKINVSLGMIVKADEIISEGTIYTALENLQNIYWLRSRPFIGFTIFTLLILFLFKKRTELLDRETRDIEEKARKEKEEARIREEELKEEARKEKEEARIREEELKEKAKEEAIKKQEEYEKEIDKIIKEKEESLEKQNKLKEEYLSVCNQFRQYESFVKFAFEDISIDELLEKNRRILGNMFRLVAEKIVFSIYDNEIRPIIEKKDSLDSCLIEIKPLNLLSIEAINALYAVKNFGNNKSHYSRIDNGTSYAKTIVIAKDLINVIEEYLPIEEKYKEKEEKKKQNSNTEKAVKNFKKGN